MQNNSSVYDSIDDIIGFLNDGNKFFKESTSKEQDFTKQIHEKSILEEQYDSLSEFQNNYEEESKKKKEQFQISTQNFSNDNAHKILMPNDSFVNPSVSKYNYITYSVNSYILSNVLLKIRYLQFKPLTDEIIHYTNKVPQDFGYYFRFLTGEIKLIKYLLEDNGFVETSHNNWTVLWSVGPIKFEIYNSLSPYQKVYIYLSLFQRYKGESFSEIL